MVSQKMCMNEKMFFLMILETLCNNYLTNIASFSDLGYHGSSMRRPRKCERGKIGGQSGKLDDQQTHFSWSQANSS